jgi:hypothetical protein
MREIPQLQVLCLRSIGSHSCSVEVTFAKNADDNTLSKASRLLRSFHQRPIEDDDSAPQDDSTTTTTTIASVPMKRTACIGKGSARRDQANEVDLNHPIIACRMGSTELTDESIDDSNKSTSTLLIMEHGNPALDCLQSYVDSLVELGRMDDSRLGLHFFEEWKCNVLLGSGKTLQELDTPRKKRRRGTGTTSPTTTNTNTNTNTNNQDLALGSLSLHNCSIFEETIGAMVEAQIGDCLGVLDITGVHSLNDAMLEQLLPTCPHILRLSIKNCRRLTRISTQLIGTHQKNLQCLDIGGSYNVTPQDLLDILPNLPDMTELHASGLAWSNPLVQELCSLRAWQGLSLGFTPYLTAMGLKDALTPIADSLQTLALPFCEAMVDNAFLGVLGRNLPNVVCLDVRGNSNLSNLTGWYDGRASANLKAQTLIVLARYSNVSKQSLEDTKRIHPLETTQMVCILDGGGVGIGIRR